MSVKKIFSVTAIRLVLVQSHFKIKFAVPLVFRYVY
jgi:hypothetical protein